MLRTVTVLFLVFGFAGSVQADIIETASFRFTDLDVRGGTDHQVEYVENTELYGLFDNYSEAFALDESGFNGGSVQSEQTSTIANGLYTVYLDARADSFSDGLELSNSRAETYFEVSFTTTEWYNFNVTGWGGAFGAINNETSITEIRIENVGVGGSASINVLMEENDYPSIDLSGRLAAGDYRLTAHSLTAVNRDFIDGFGDANAGASFTMSLTAVPEPASVVLLGMGGLMVMLRRRRNCRV